METAFYQKIANSTAHRPIRDELSGMVLQDKSLLSELMGIVLTTTDKIHHKACWIAELVFEANIEWIQECLDAFCEVLPVTKNDSAIRPLSKICLFAAQHHLKYHKFLSDKQSQKITAACFDWLIDPDKKVAAKAYAMHTLYLLGKNEIWIHSQLLEILPQDFPNHTAAYKAAAKDILKKINRATKNKP